LSEKTLVAAKVADEILRLATTLTDQDINDVLRKISTLDNTWGIIWGLKNIQRSSMDMDYYLLKQKVLLFLQDLRKEDKFHLAVTVAAIREQRGDIYE